MSPSSNSKPADLPRDSTTIVVSDSNSSKFLSDMHSGHSVLHAKFSVLVILCRVILMIFKQQTTCSTPSKTHEELDLYFRWLQSIKQVSCVHFLKIRNHVSVHGLQGKVVLRKRYRTFMNWNSSRISSSGLGERVGALSRARRALRGRSFFREYIFHVGPNYQTIYD